MNEYRLSRLNKRRRKKLLKIEEKANKLENRMIVLVISSIPLINVYRVPTMGLAGDKMERNRASARLSYSPMWGHMFLLIAP